MPEREYGPCTVCGRRTAVRRNGLLYAHGKRDAYDSWCQGSSLPPAADGEPVVMRVLLDPSLKELVRAGCKRLDMKPTDLTRRALREYLHRH